MKYSLFAIPRRDVRSPLDSYGARYVAGVQLKNSERFSSPPPRLPGPRQSYRGGRSTMQAEPKTSLNRDYVRSIPQDMWPRFGWIAAFNGHRQPARRAQAWRLTDSRSIVDECPRRATNSVTIVQWPTISHEQIANSNAVHLEDPLLGQLLQIHELAAGVDIDPGQRPSAVDRLE